MDLSPRGRVVLQFTLANLHPPNGFYLAWAAGDWNSYCVKPLALNRMKKPDLTNTMPIRIALMLVVTAAATAYLRADERVQSEMRRPTLES